MSALRLLKAVSALLMLLVCGNAYAQADDPRLKAVLAIAKEVTAILDTDTPDIKKLRPLLSEKSQKFPDSDLLKSIVQYREMFGKVISRTLVVVYFAETTADPEMQKIDKYRDLSGPFAILRYKVRFEKYNEGSEYLVLRLEHNEWRIFPSRNFD
ncbi:MAG: hypothetical protein AB7R40_25000 [Nitrospiraceae bacterium]